MNLFEAFKALDALNEDTFAISNDGIAKLDEFQNDDEVTDTLDIIDADAETEDDLQDSYVGKVILDCGVCHSKIYKDKEEVELNDDQTLANVGEECPFCSTSDGFKVIGEVADYSASTADAEDEDLEDGETNDSLEEGIGGAAVGGALGAAAGKGIVGKAVGGVAGAVAGNYIQNKLNQKSKPTQETSDEKVDESVLGTLALAGGAGLLGGAAHAVGKKVTSGILNNSLESDEVQDKEGLDESVLGTLALAGGAGLVGGAAHAVGKKVTSGILNNSLESNETEDQEGLDESVLGTLALAGGAGLVGGAAHAVGKKVTSGILNNSLEEPQSTPIDEAAAGTMEKPMSTLGGTLSNVMISHKDELARISERDEAITFLDMIEPEVKNKGYLNIVKEKITKVPNNRISQFLYNIILKGDGMGTKMESVKDDKSLEEFIEAPHTQMDPNINRDARGFGGKDNNVSVLGGKVPFGESADVDDELEEGIFGGNKYKDKDLLVYRGNGEDKVIAIGERGGNNHNLYYFKQAHMKKNGAKESDYVSVSPTSQAVKKYKASLKTADDVSTKLPFWVQQSTDADKEKRTQDFRNAEAQKEREAKARRDAERDRYRNRKEHNPDDDYTYIRGNGSGTYRYREELDEAEFSGGMAGDNSINGGKVGGMGASTQPDHKTYLNRIKAKNPKLVDIITIKAKDLKPNMMTQAGQIKTAEVKYSGYHSKDMVYVVHTNGWDYFKELDADMEVMADPDNKSNPFTGNYRDLLKMGLQEAMNESVNNVNVETDDSVVNVSTDETGKITVTTEPNTAASATEGDEVIAPVSPETEDAIINGTEEPVEDSQEVDAQVDEFDEKSFDEVSESYLKEVYDNVTSFLTESVKERKNSLIVEGYITFDSGKRAKTSFVLEAKDCTKGGTYRFVGSNKHLTEDAKPYLLTGKLARGKFICESLKYDYSTGSDVVSGTVKRG